MRATVTEQGLLIPKQILAGMQEVEIRKQNGVVTIVPIASEDPIFGLGQNPVTCGTTDASENHDQYLYNADSSTARRARKT